VAKVELSPPSPYDSENPAKATITRLDDWAIHAAKTVKKEKDKDPWALNTYFRHNRRFTLNHKNNTDKC
jgi:hypothetical protein